MNENRRLWKCQAIAERILCLSVSISMEAASNESRAFAVVADEAEGLGTILLELVEAVRFGELAEEVFEDRASVEAERLELLSVNAGIEALKTPLGKGVAICADGLRKAALEFRAILAPASRLASEVPLEAMKPSLASGTRGWFLAFEIGGLRFAEGLDFVREVLRFDREAQRERSDRFDLRGRLIPLIDPRVRLGLSPTARDEGRRLVVVNKNWNGKPDEEIAVVVDRIGAGALFRSPIGLPCTAPSALPEGLLRECWLASDGGWFLFAQWDRFVS